MSYTWMALLTMVWAELTTLSPAVASPVAPPGQRWPIAPLHLPLTPIEPSLLALRHALQTRRPIEALHIAQGLHEHLPPGRERSAVDLAIGLLHRDAGRHHLASEAFTRVRRGRGPLAAWGAYLEAEQDLARGRPRTAAAECDRYRQTWPKGRHAGACLRLAAVARASVGDAENARIAAKAYDKTHPKGPIGEQVELALARHWLDVGNPPAATEVLATLALEHEAPLTGRTAEAWLSEVGDRPALDLEAQMTRAITLRDASRSDEAWAAFEALVSIADDNPEIEAFVVSEAERFGWRTRNWGFLDEHYAARYAEEPGARVAWARYRVLFRAGRHDDASDLALRMQRTHATHRSWRRKNEDIARTLLLAGRYGDARHQFDQVATRGGWSGRRAKFFGGFAALMADLPLVAATRFDALIQEDRGWQASSRYWRARAFDRLGRADEAAADRTWILENEPTGWYATLLRNQTDGSVHHAGRWFGPRARPQTVPPAPLAWPSSPIVAGPVVPRRNAADRVVGVLSWPWPQATPPPPSTAMGDPRPHHPPTPNRPAPFWEPQAGAEALSAFVEAHGRTWPELRAIEDLARVGLTDLSGPWMAEWYDQWRRDYRRNRNGARRVRRMNSEDWRTLFLATSDHHHASRHCFGSWDRLPEDTTEADRRAAWRLAYPIAHGSTVWTESQLHDVDPFLVLGLMRQESTYDATAVSRVGARGAMQIMPKTGHLLADRINDPRFTAADLEDPQLAIGYGIRYLGLLLDRFDGVFPLAVAAYNAGPFNVSAWLQGPARDLPMDALVEHVPFRETRDYVKRVTANYDTYVRLYSAADAAVAVPRRVRGDHREVVDF